MCTGEKMWPGFPSNSHQGTSGASQIMRVNWHCILSKDIELQQQKKNKEKLQWFTHVLLLDVRARTKKKKAQPNHPTALTTVIFSFDIWSQPIRPATSAYVEIPH